jgi:hypothetical protein
VLVGELECGYAIGAEMAIVAAQFAPGHHHANTIEERQRKRPHRAACLRPILIDIGDGELALRPDRLADCRQLRVAGSDLHAGPDQQPRSLSAVAHIVRQDRNDLGQRVAGCLAEWPVGALGDPARSEHQRLDLLFGEHQRRQHEARAQYVTNARLGVDMRALRFECLDIAIERAQSHAELLRQRSTADRKAMPAKDLDQIEQALRTRHG